MVFAQMIVDAFIEFIFGRFWAGLVGNESGLVWLRRHALFCAAKKCYLQTNKTRLKKKDVQTRVSAVVNIGVL